MRLMGNTTSCYRCGAADGERRESKLERYQPLCGHLISTNPWSCMYDTTYVKNLYVAYFSWPQSSFMTRTNSHERTNLQIIRHKPVMPDYLSLLS
jgi:hypothetical protein